MFVLSLNIKKIEMKFLKNILAAFIGVGAFFGLLFLLIMVITAIASSTSNGNIIVKKDTILKIHLDEPLKDYGGQFAVEKVNYTYEKHNGLNGLLKAIEYAKTDDKIAAISIESKSTQAGWSQLQALRKQLLDFKDSGKKIYAYSDGFSQKDYYLSTVADSIYLNPVAQVELKGLSTEILYFKEIQEKTGVKMEVIRHGKYKSAVEPFLADTMSEANQEQITALINSLWSTIRADIAKDRNLDTATINTIADSLNGRTAKRALTNQLVDALGYYDQYSKALMIATGKEISDTQKQPHTISLHEYATSVGNKKSKKYKADKIAVVYAQGDIMYTDGDENTIGPKTIIKALQEARKNDKVKAIVFRVNSPGGSALASELIWREVARTKAIKPVIVSMGDLAASGGYYIACNSDYIVAEPNTITGSIGVFGVLPNFKKLADNIGINAEQVSTNAQSIGYSPFEPLSNDFKNVMTESIENIYDTFVTHVAEGRKMTYEKADSLGQGRVWTGKDALQNGLVDELGGLQLAIQRAAEKVEITDYSIKNYPVYAQDFEQLLNTLGEFPFIASKTTVLKEALGAQNYELFQTIKELSLQKGVQVRMPYTLNIH